MLRHPLAATTVLIACPLFHTWFSCNLAVGFLKVSPLADLVPELGM